MDGAGMFSLVTVGGVAVGLAVEVGCCWFGSGGGYGF